VARDQLRKMNIIGLDNVEGFDPEMLQKFDKKETHKKMMAEK